MRFDPQANFVPQDRPPRNLAAAPPVAADHFPPGVSVRSPLKTALIILTLGFAGGGGYWIWNEGVPGMQPKAIAEPPAGAGAGSAVVQYAEALVNGEMEAQLTGLAAGNSPKSRTASSRKSAGKRRTRVKEEYEAGRKLMAMGRHDEAVPHFAEAVRLDPAYADAHYRLGLAYVQVGDIRSAKRTRAALAKIDTDLANLLAHLIDN
jgi:tetratricopeptide (TPR) repeat protein